MIGLTKHTHSRLIFMAEKWLVQFNCVSVWPLLKKPINVLLAFSKKSSGWKSPLELTNFERKIFVLHYLSTFKNHFKEL